MLLLTNRKLGKLNIVEIWFNMNAPIQHMFPTYGKRMWNSMWETMWDSMGDTMYSMWDSMWEKLQESTLDCHKGS